MTIRQLTMATAIMAVTLGGFARADERLQLKDAPSAVQKGVQKNLKGATFKNLSKEVEGGKTLYEVESILDGHSRDFLLDTAGRLVEVEEEMAMNAVPPAVKMALEARGKIVKVESVTKGKTVTYEGTIEKDGKKSEVAVDANGKTFKG